MKLKILFAGLSGAGKTSIIRTLRKERIEDIRPTVNKQITEFQLLGSDIVSWDLGGQEAYRERFLDHFDEYLRDTHILLFVASVQEQNTEKEALTFLETILTKLEGITILPHLGILLHKFDPNIKEISKVEKFVGSLEMSIHKRLTGSPLDYYIFRTSIYNPTSLMAAFAVLLNSRFPKGEFISSKIQEICMQLDSPMGMIYAVGGEKERPFLFGRYILSGSDPGQAVQFIKKTYELAESSRVYWSQDDVTRVPLSKSLEIIGMRCFVGGLIAVYSTALPIGKFDQDPAIRKLLALKLEDFRDLIETIAVGTGLTTVVSRDLP